MGSHHTKPGQSRTTLNLTTSAPALIDYPASHCGPAENPVVEASELSGQTDGASCRLQLSSAGGARSRTHQVNAGTLLPVRVMHGTVVPGEDSHKTARSEGNITCKDFNDLNISKLEYLPPSSPVVQSVITLSSEIIIGGGQNFSKRKVNSVVWSHLTVAASVAGAWLGALCFISKLGGRKSPKSTYSKCCPHP